MPYIWERIDSPSEEVLGAHAPDHETLLAVRAWEIEESPADLGYRVMGGWPRLPDGWKLGQVAGVAADQRECYYIYHRGNEAPPLICFNREASISTPGAKANTSDHTW